MGLAIDGKVYAGGATYISNDNKINYGLIDGKTHEPISGYLSNIDELLAPGLYFTTLAELNKLNGFASFMYGYSYKAPVLIDVPAPNFISAYQGIYVAFARLCYTQYCEKNSINYGRYSVYSDLCNAGAVPLFRPEELSDFTFITKYSTVDNNINNISYSDLSNITGVCYKGNQVDFLSSSMHSSTIYVGGYGVSYSLPNTNRDNYVYMVPHLKGNTGKYIAIRPLEYPYLVSTNNLPQSYGQRGYTFTPDNDHKTIIWDKKDSNLNLVNNITYSYLLEPGCISFGVDYNPNAFTAIGMPPYDEPFFILDTFVSLNHIGVLPDNTYIKPNDVEDTSNSLSYLPLGKYRLFSSKYTDCPIESGTTAINVYSPDGGSTVKQELFSDPALDNNTYHKFERLVDSKGNFSDWLSSKF